MNLQLKIMESNLLYCDHTSTELTFRPKGFSLLYHFNHVFISLLMAVTLMVIMITRYDQDYDDCRTLTERPLLLLFWPL